ncbi:hypothetical protein ACIBBD_35900 [Streptomyces sp. NPDC051315]|uniref:DUF7919 family protein n=1 Tax=Streptomyces sp. NPDC051315 TaxID=3365650 RepID=UPI0037A638DF
MEYLDLSPYEYAPFPLPLRCIGWLGREHGVQGDGEPPVTTAELARLRATSQRLGSVMLGVHECEFCPEESAFEGNGEFRYYLGNGESYSAPMMVLHYIEAHGYRPPLVFREGLAETVDLPWDGRAQRLSEILLDVSQDLDLRYEAVIDLANWPDARSLDALERAAADEELADIASEEIHRSRELVLGRLKP